jgi:protein SCO1/2
MSGARGSRRPLLYVMAALVGAGVGLALYLAIGEKMLGPTLSSAPASSQGRALIGGPFKLIDQNGATRTDKDFRGKYVLVYFGYTHCPDICPTELQAMADALAALGDDAKKVQPLFITVDPARDTPALLKTYVSNFDKRLIGLTGSAKAVAKAAKAYRVYYAKRKGSGPDDYTMDHSSFIYLMGPDGLYRTHFSHGTPPAKMAERIRAQF